MLDVRRHDLQFIFGEQAGDLSSHQQTVEELQEILVLDLAIRENKSSFFSLNPKDFLRGSMLGKIKAIYHSQDTVCIWVFKSREDRNNFMNETVGMNKADREKYFSDNYG